MYLKKLIKPSSIFFTLLFLFIFGFTYFQLQTHHWSAEKPFDLTTIYNSLIVGFGYDQQFRDHPGFTQYFLHGSLYKLFAIFDSDIPKNLELYLEAENKNYVIQKLFILSRYLNSLFYFIFFVYFFKLLNFYKIERIYIFLSITFFLTIESILYGLIRIRPDIVAILFFLLSYYNLSLYFKKNKISLLFFSGLFLFLSLMTKIQTVLYLPLIFINLLFNVKKIKNFELDIFKHKFDIKKKYINLFFLICYLGYFVLQILLKNHNQQS